MQQVFDNQPASRVVEHPKRSLVPYFAIAVVAAIVLWSVVQPNIDDRSSPVSTRSAPSAATTPTMAERRQGPNSARGDLRTLFSADDYPAQAQMRGEEGTVQVELAVDPAGRVSNCTVRRTSGSSALDWATCSILTRRARFYPAHDAAGNAVPDTVTSPPIVWRLAG